MDALGPLGSPGMFTVLRAIGWASNGTTHPEGNTTGRKTEYNTFRVCEYGLHGLGEILLKIFSVPGSGSFIRPSKSISYGCTFLDALSSKYIELLHGEKRKESVVLGSSNGIIEVEAVGLDKIRSKLSNLQNLKQVSLDGENIAACDPPGSISKISPSTMLSSFHIVLGINDQSADIRGLNLSKNLIASWAVVAFIASELPKLEVLDLRFDLHFSFKREQSDNITA